MQQRRKRVVLTIEDKLDILKLIDKSVSYHVIAEKYSIGKSTVGDIKKNRDKIMKFQQDATDMGMKKKAKTMKLGEDRKLEEALYIWFRQKRMEGAPVSGPMLQVKARQLNELLQGRRDFTASEGWKWRFCQRYGIRQLSMQGEKFSSDEGSAKEFVEEFRKFFREKQLSLHQVFNCDESGLNYRLLPEATLAASFEKSAAGRKKSKEQVTFNVCSNASGTVKLPLQIIGKAKRPRCFKGVDLRLLPVNYCNQKNSWMTTTLFTEWFHEQFVPFVSKELVKLGETPKAVLILDNCSAHPEPDELVSDDGEIFAKFLPPNVTALIQPMDQGVIKSIKARYKKKLLRRLIIQEDGNNKSIVDFLKEVNMRVVIDLIDEAWTEISHSTLRKSWRKILPMPKVSSDPIQGESADTCNEQQAPCAAASSCQGEHSDSQVNDEHEQAVEDGIQEFIAMFEELGISVEKNAITDWLDSDLNELCVPVYTDEEICNLVSQSDMPGEEQDDSDGDSEEEDNSSPDVPSVTHSEAARMFEWCLQWLEQQPEANVHNTTVLRELQVLASKKRLGSLKQTKMDNFFQN